MNDRFYAGIGPREVPLQVCIRLTDTARLIAGYGYRLSSGGAAGCDTAFEEGARDARTWSAPEPRIYREDAAAGHIAAFELAARFHDKWDTLKVGHRRLLARNTYILLSPTLDQPVDFVTTYHQGQNGGTKHSLRIAEYFGIPVFNLLREAEFRRLVLWLQERG